MSEKKTVTTSSGVVLDQNSQGAVIINKHAKSLGLDWITGFLATHPDGDKNYVLVNGRDVIWESPKLEDICVHLDIMAMQRRS